MHEKENTKSCFAGYLGPFVLLVHIAQGAFCKSANQGAYQEKASRFSRTQEKSSQIHKQMTKSGRFLTNLNTFMNLSECKGALKFRS